MVTDSDTNRPYAPPSNVVAVLHRLRSRNLPERIDAEYLRDASISEGTVSRALFALRYLGLTGEAGEPTPALRTIHTSTDEEYRETLAGLVREAYADVFNVVDPSEDSQDRILNVFRRYTPASQRSRMVIFFLGMCREAGIPTLDTPRQRSMGEPRTRNRPSAAPRRESVATRQQSGRDAGKGSRSNVSPALEGLVASLPPPGTPMDEERRQQWLEMAKATLAFVYPTEADPDGDAEGGEASE